MAEQIQREVQSAVEHFQNSIHKIIMPLQRSAYRCMADCSDAAKSPDVIERCYAGCQGPIEKADSHVQFVINNFQRELSCGDTPCLFDSFRNRKHLENSCNVGCQNEKSQEAYESCVSQCAGKVLKQFPNDTDDLVSKLKSL